MMMELITGIIILTLVALLFVIIPLIKHKAIFTALIIFVLLPLIAGILYFHWGKANGLLSYAAHQQQALRVKAELAKIKNPQQVVDQLQTYLHDHPNNPKGWYLLGKVYLTQNNYREALTALTKAHEQAADNIEYSVAYAMAVFFTNQKQLTPATKQLLEQVLLQSPNHVAATNLLAIDAYNQGQYNQAIHYWEKLIPLFDPQSEDEKLLLQMISRAQKTNALR
jgi:cytochrome c-type biogenesis protein CcmH/NrfG